MSDYAAAGVDIEAGQEAVGLMKKALGALPAHPRVLSDLGSFGGLFDASGLGNAPVLVASTDGVGTKVILASWAGRYRGLGHDLVNHCINDILVQGARPLFFLDYIACSKLVPEMAAEIVTGIAEACSAAGCALLGGETAEMPGVYKEGQIDIAGTIVGVVERASLLPRKDMQAGDWLVGFPSSGPHTNGYSLIRKILYGVPLDTVFPELEQPLVDLLLAPHRSYLAELGPHLGSVKALAHLTGGGLWDNLPRILPEGLHARVNRSAWVVPPLFSFLQERGQVEEDEMFRVFNMGIGMMAVVSPGETLGGVRLGVLEEGPRGVSWA